MDTTMLFLGGLIIAVALEETGLHTRISLGVLRIIGAQPIIMMLGMMGTTWFLSMWISNTAATAMMIPIITAVVGAVREARITSMEEGAADNEAFEMDKEPETNGTDDNQHEEYEGKRSGKNAYIVNTPSRKDGNTQEAAEMNRFAKGLALCVAYGANIGGIATLTGTPPNLVLKDVADKYYQSYGLTESPISFAKWMGFAFPLSLMVFFVGWLWLAIIFLRSRAFKRIDPRTRNAVNSTIKQRFDRLGRITMAESLVLIVFLLLVILWLFRSPPNIDGWGILWMYEETKTYVSDSTACILLGVVLFIIPSKAIRRDEAGIAEYTPILNWSVVNQKLPWGVIILLGGGFAIANASKETGLSAFVGNWLKTFQNLKRWEMNIIISIIVAAATEVTSNTATAQLLLPVFQEMSISIGYNPLYIMMSATIACSFAFMLPVATPPNAIVFSTGYLTIPDMALAGLPMNVIGVLCLTLAINTWGQSMYDLDVMPGFLTTTLATNMTTIATTTIPSNFTTVLPMNSTAIT